MAADVWDLSDEELEAAFREAKAQEDSPETGLDAEEETYEDEVVDEEVDEEVELEQPDEQDSDDDTSLDAEDEKESEDVSEAEESEPDEELEADEEQADEEDEESNTDKQPEQSLEKQLEEFFNQSSKVRANGMDYEFTNKEKLEMFDKMFPQASDYTKKMQALKPHRKTIDAIEQAGLGHNDINLMIDVLKGDKDAIAEVLKRTGTDALDLDTEQSNYVAKDYGRDDVELTIKDIVDEISVDKEYSITHNVLDKQWDDKSREAFIEDPNMIKLLHADVKSGMFDKVNPIAQKLKVYDNGTKSDLDYYKLAAQQYFENEAKASQAAQEQAAVQEQQAKAAQEQARLQEVKAKQQKQTAIRQNSNKRKAAAPTRKAAGTKKAVDYLDDSDEAFEEWYSKLQENF